MSLISSTSFFSETIESCSSLRESISNHDQISEPSSEKKNKEGFSSSMILNLENDNEKISKPCSKLISITKIIPGSKKEKKILLPIFYRKSPCSKTEKKISYFEQAVSEKNISQYSFEEYTDTKQEFRRENTKPHRVNSTTVGSLRTLSNFDLEPNHNFFTEKMSYDYESELRASIQDGNVIAYCHKCKKETVTVIQNERFKGFKSFKDILLCCCSYVNNKKKIFLCPTCSEILIS